MIVTFGSATNELYRRRPVVVVLHAVAKVHCHRRPMRFCTLLYVVIW